MVGVGIDTSILKSLQNYQDKMLPYICRNTLKRTMRQCYAYLKVDIPRRFPGRGGMSWMMRGLDIIPATTNRLVTAIYFQMPQSHILTIHETGGVKTPKGAKFAIPIAAELRRPGKRIPQQLQPKWLLGTKAGTAFRPGHEIGGGYGPLQSFFERMAKRAKGKRIRNTGRLKTFGSGSVQQKGFLVKTGEAKWFIVTRLSKGVIKFWYYLAPMARIQEALKFRETCWDISTRNIQANFNKSVGEINRAFEKRAAAEAVRGSTLGAKETANAYE